MPKSVTSKKVAPKAPVAALPKKEAARARASKEVAPKVAKAEPKPAKPAAKPAAKSVGKSVGKVAPKTPVKLRKSEAELPPRAPRVSMLVHAECVGEEGQHFELIVKNLSGKGVGGMGRNVPPVDVGEPVTLTMKGVNNIKGRVAWVDENRMGIVFDRQFNIRRLNIAAWWTGPAFSVSDTHKPLEDFKRPGFSHRLSTADASDVA